MFAISVRDSPCSAFDSRSSSGRATEMTPSCCETVIGSATTWLKVPFGPFTVTLWPSIVISTPEGTGVGNLEPRDVALLLEDLGNVPLHLRVGHLHGVVERGVRIAQTGQHVCDRIGHCHCVSSFSRRFPSPGLP